MGRYPPVQVIHGVRKEKKNITWIPFRLVCLAYLLLSIKLPGQMLMSVKALSVYDPSSQLTVKSN